MTTNTEDVRERESKFLTTLSLDGSRALTNVTGRVASRPRVCSITLLHNNTCSACVLCTQDAPPTQPLIVFCVYFVYVFLVFAYRTCIVSYHRRPASMGMSLLWHPAKCYFYSYILFWVVVAK